MHYPMYRYLYPPRPTTAGAPSTLHNYEASGWLGQAKMNGTCTTLYVRPDQSNFAMGRAGPANKLIWQPGDRWNAFQKRLFPGTGWYVFVGELLHSKGVGVRDTIYLHDLLVENGNYLVGVTYRDRMRLLKWLCDGHDHSQREIHHTHTIICPGVWLAHSHLHSFTEWFDSIRNMPGKPPVEGLVFKDPDSKLMPCGSATSNVKGQHKCRVATNHLSF